MQFGIFYEHQLPRPWSEGGELELFQEALDQVELADRLGIDHAWEVEHHFLEEYSHSSAPEVFLAAASQRTKRIRLGHGIVLMPPGYNHPARVAERIATLDLVSNGRVEFGTGESASRAELEGFGITFRHGIEKNFPSKPGYGSITNMFATCSTHSRHIARFSCGEMPKPSSSAREADSPVPKSTRPFETRSSVAIRSATRAG